MKATSRVTVVWSPPDAAARVAKVLLTAVERLAELPNLGRSGRVSGTRELVVPGTPYVAPMAKTPAGW